MILEQEPKQKIEIHIKIEYDDEVARSDYDDLIIGNRQRYMDKGFSLEQAKHFNRRYEDMFERIENGSMDCIWVKVYANIEMPCGHIEEFSDSLGGIYAENRQDILNAIKWNGMIENVKQEIEDKGINVKYDEKEYFDN